jgi:hypothetical protein
LLEAEFASLVLLACTQLGAERLRLLRGVDPSGIKRDAPTIKIAFRVRVVLIRKW